MWVLEQHEVLELGPRIESQVVFFILSEEVAHLLLEDPLCIKRLLKLINSILEFLHLRLHLSCLCHKSVHLIVLLLKLSLTHLPAYRKIPVYPA